MHIRTENTNDEAPYFIPTRQYTAFVAEDALGGTPIVTVQALDADRDQVSYTFRLADRQESTITELFEIDKDTGIWYYWAKYIIFVGLIKLRNGVKAENLAQQNGMPYNLTVVARDDGSCCASSTGADTVHEETAIVLIGKQIGSDMLLLLSSSM